MQSRLDPLSYICPGKLIKPTMFKSEKYILKIHFQDRQQTTLDLGQPEGVLGDKGEQDGEGNEGVEPGNVRGEERGRNLENILPRS